MIVFIRAFPFGSAGETGRVDLRAAGLTFKFKKRRQLFIRSRNEALKSKK
jgi:hypothetical protein